MAIRGIGDAYAFRRLLWLVLGTVVVPTLLLSLYGVYAVRNQRAAIRERLAASWDRTLSSVAARTYDELDRVEASVEVAARACAPLPCAPTVKGAATVDVWALDADAPPGLPTPAGAVTAWATLPDGRSIGAFRRDARNVAWSPDRDALARYVAGFSDDDGTVIGLRPSRAAATTPLEMVQRWQQSPHAATLPLEGPLVGYRLVLDEPAAAEVVGLTAWLYSLGLAFLVATVLVGVTVTLRSTMRELQLSRLQRDFVSSVSHELRTPLTSIRMFVDTLQSGRLQDPERVKECLSLLSEETDRLQRRIERVLLLARMESGRRLYDVEPVPVGDVVEDALTALRSQTLLDDRVLPIDVALPTDLPKVLVDRDAIAEAVLNLLQNALRHADGATRVQVRATVKKGRVGVAIADDGAGIPREHRRRIFEKFYQVNPLLASSNHSSGLGLAIVRAIVAGHGGKVTLDTEVGRGSTFTVWLPIAT